MGRLSIPRIAGLALLGSTTVAMAQGHGQHGFGGGARGGGAVHAPGGGGMQSGPGGGGRAFQAPRGYQAPRQASPRSYQQRGRQVERPAHRSERSRDASRRAAPNRQRAQGNLNRNKRTERNAERNRLSTRPKGPEGGGREASERGLEHRAAERHNEMEQARTKLGAQDRERLHKAFNFDRARLTKVNFDHRVGHRVPRHIRLFAIPAAVFGFFPYYRDYSYFAVDDDICIVDPRSYAIVDVIDRGYWDSGGRPQVAGLRLSQSEMALVRDSIPRDFPVADVHLRLALGAEIPEDIQLHEFAVLVLDRVPQLRRYRFVATEDQIVIVDPGDHVIALVIDRA